MSNYTAKFNIAQVTGLPKKPGVYLFKKGREVLYIGKAANLRDRVQQHRGTRVLNQVKRIAYVETGSEIEALILEAKLIKKYQPKYNVLWRDDKNFFWVAITKEKLPRVFITHQIKKSEILNSKSETNYKSKILNSKLISNFDIRISNFRDEIAAIGPFVDGRALKQTLRYLRKVFPYYTARIHPKTKCPWCHLSLCPGPAPNPKKYQKSVKNLIKVLEGKRKSVLLGLKKEMAEASRKQDFEKAAVLRDQIAFLEKIISHARVLSDAAGNKIKQPYLRIEGYDIANIQGKFAAGAMVVFEKGKPDKTQYRKFKISWTKTPNDIAMLKEVLKRRFRHLEWPLPDLILMDGGKAQLNAALSIAKNYKLKFEIVALAKDKKHRGVKIYTAGKKKPTQLSKLSEAFGNLLLRVNSEAHRFAIGYYRNLHRKSFR